MKDRIIIPKDKIKVLTSCGHFPANGYFTFYKEDVEVEQVPETFAEFQEICEKVIDKSKHDFEAHKGFTAIDEYQFRDDGSVWLYYENVDIVRNITIFQMWLILKGIFGVSNHL